MVWIKSPLKNTVRPRLLHERAGTERGSRSRTIADSAVGRRLRSIHEDQEFSLAYVRSALPGQS